MAQRPRYRRPDSARPGRRRPTDEHGTSRCRNRATQRKRTPHVLDLLQRLRHPANRNRLDHRQLPHLGPLRPDLPRPLFDRRDRQTSNRPLAGEPGGEGFDARRTVIRCSGRVVDLTAKSGIGRRRRHSRFSGSSGRRGVFCEYYGVTDSEGRA